MTLRIGELAKRAGLTVRTLHYYDHIGLLSPSVRSDSGFRLYSEADVIRLHRIQALKQFGCSLSEIGAFLAEPGASLTEIITRQMSVLEDQVLHARSLLDRLSRLRKRITRGESTGLTDWLTILELMTMYEKVLSRQELDALRSNKAAGNLDEEWSKLLLRVTDAVDRGMPPESEEAQALAKVWMRILRKTTGNDPGLALKLKQIHSETEKLHGISPGIIEYISRAFTHARDSIFLKYLTREELETIHGRQAAHGAHWPPLIAEVRRQMEGGAEPDDPAVQALARRWESLFRESYGGDEPALANKIRAAFRNEPDLLLSIGVDAPLIAFVEEALSHVRHSRDTGGNPSPSAPRRTALRVAIFRAAHQLLDTPLVFEDPLALKILGPAEAERLRCNPTQYNTPLLKGLRASVVVRGRLAEDRWTEARHRGVRQLVILGAGLDTLAYRSGDRDGSRIFEVDLRATQQWKRHCLSAAGIPEPLSLTYVPIDFERSLLGETLDGAGFRRDEPAFVSWLGVTMYIEEPAIISTLQWIASLAPGSGVVFDYGVIPSLLPPRERKVMEILSARASEHGEPWKSLLDPASVTEMLRGMGFSRVEDLGPEQLNERYLSGREDGLRKGGVSRLVCAGV